MVCPELGTYKYIFKLSKYLGIIAESYRQWCGAILKFKK